MTDCQEKNSSITPADGDEALPQNMAVCMDKFARTFEASARRWELVVYPSMLAFIVLASYGFYLIYMLTSDVSRLARSMETVVVSMNDVSANMTAVSGNVGHISGNLSLIAHEVGDGTDSMKTMLMKMDKINNNIGVMTVPMYQIRNDMGRMSENIHDVSSPMKMVNGMVPW
jgi:hypothetical protein